MSSSVLENVFIIGTGESKIQKRLKTSLWNSSIKKYTASSSFERLRKMTSLGSVDLIVVEDTDDAPLPIQLREILNHPLTCMVPCIVFTSSRHSLEKSLIGDLEYVFAMNSDSNHDDIQASFAPIQALGASESYITKRKIIFEYANAGVEGATAYALKICKGTNYLGSVAPTLAGFLIEQGKNDEAEQILKSAIQTKSNVLGNILALTHVYLRIGKPDEALKFANHVANQYKEAIFPKLDLLSAQLLSDRIAEVEESLISLTTYKPLAEQASFGLLKLYLATHRRDKVEALGFDEEFLSYSQSRWHGLEDRLKRAS